MKRAQEANRRFGRSFGRLRAGVVSAINPFHALGGAVAGLAGTYGFVMLIRRGEEFNKAMAQSQAIMSGLTDTLRVDMRSAAIEMSKTSVFSATEAARAMFFLASAGLDAEKSIKALPIVTRFAQAGMFDLSTATDLVTDAQSALGLAVDDTIQNMKNMERVSDVLVQANNVSNATVQQFSESLTNGAAPALRIVNKEIEEGVAVLAAYAAQGIKGAEAGTAFAIVMRDLATKAIQNEAAFKKMGIEVFDAAGDMQNIADIIGDLERALAGMSDQQSKATLLMLGFSDKSLKYIQNLLGTSDAIRQYEADLRNAGGTTARVAEANITPMQRALNALKGEWDDMTSGMQAANSAVTAGIQVLTGMLKIIRTFGRELVYTIAILGGFKVGMMIGGVVSGAILAISKLRTAYLALTSAQKAVSAGQAIMLALTGPAGWIALAAGAAVATTAVIGVSAAFDAAADDAGAFANNLGKVNQEVRSLEQRMADVSQTFLIPDLQSLRTTQDASAFIAQIDREIVQLEHVINGFRGAYKDLSVTAYGLTVPIELVTDGMNDQVMAMKGNLDALKEMRRQAELFEENLTSVSAAAAFANQDLETLIGTLQKQVESLEAATDGYAVLAEAMAAGADPALLTQAEELLRRIDFLKASVEAEKLAESLRKQINELRMGANEAILYELALKGVADTTLEMVRALQAELDLLNEQEEIMRRGQQIWEQTRTPLERYNEALRELQRLLDAGAIDWETYQRAIKDAEEELARFQDRQIAADERQQRTGEFRQVDLSRTAINGVQGSNKEAQRQQAALRSIEEAIERFRKMIESKPVPVEAVLG